MPPWVCAPNSQSFICSGRAGPKIHSAIHRGHVCSISLCCMGMAGCIGLGWSLRCARLSYHPRATYGMCRGLHASSTHMSISSSPQSQREGKGNRWPLHRVSGFRYLQTPVQRREPWPVTTKSHLMRSPGLARRDTVQHAGCRRGEWGQKYIQFHSQWLPLPCRHAASENEREDKGAWLAHDDMRWDGPARTAVWPPYCSTTSTGEYIVWSFGLRGVVKVHTSPGKGLAFLISVRRTVLTILLVQRRKGSG